jgi:DNA-binding MurR/RpiR family transcriptional regulator
MVSISFTPHSRFTVTETEFMKKIGCKVIAFTDSVVNPLRHVADYNPILEISRDEITGFINTAPAISLLDYMVRYMYKNYQERIDDHIKNSRKYYDYDEYI